MRKGTLAEFLLASPLRGADLELERQQTQRHLFVPRVEQRHAERRKILDVARDQPPWEETAPPAYLGADPGGRMP